MLTAVATVPLALWMLTTPSLLLAYVLNFPVTLFSSMWIGAGASTVQDLVLPRMRAVASAAYLLVVTFIGLALGPYMVGKLSVAFGSLQTGMTIGLAANLCALVCLLLASRHLESDESTLRRRAAAAGEAIAE
jgi:fucose permease